MGKLLVGIMLAVVALAMIPQIRGNGVVRMGWFVLFLGMAVTVLFTFTWARSY